MRFKFSTLVFILLMLTCFEAIESLKNQHNERVVMAAKKKQRNLARKSGALVSLKGVNEQARRLQMNPPILPMPPNPLIQPPVNPIPQYQLPPYGYSMPSYVPQTYRKEPSYSKSYDSYSKKSKYQKSSTKSYKKSKPTDTKNKFDSKLDSIQSLLEKNGNEDEENTKKLEEALKNLQDKIAQKKLYESLGIVPTQPEQLLLPIYSLLPHQHYQNKGYKEKYDDDDDDEETEDAIKDLNNQLQSKLSIIEEKLNRLQDKVARNNIDGSLEEEEDKLKLIVDKLKRLEQRFNDEIPPPQPSIYHNNNLYANNGNQDNEIAKQIKKLEESISKVEEKVSAKPINETIVNNNVNEILKSERRIRQNQLIKVKEVENQKENYKKLEEKLEDIKDALKSPYPPNSVHYNPYAYSPIPTSSGYTNPNTANAANQPISITNQISERKNSSKISSFQKNSQHIRSQQRQKIGLNINQLKQLENDKIESINEKLEKIEEKLSENNDRDNYLNPYPNPYTHAVYGPNPLVPVVPVEPNPQTNLLPLNVQQLVLLQQLQQQLQQQSQQQNSNSNLESKIESLERLLNKVSQNVVVQQDNRIKKNKSVVTND